MHSHN